MPRPPKYRIVEGIPGATVFKPAGIPKYELQEMVLTLDEFEAVRLADFLGSYQEEAAEAMGVSRQTFGNILVEAHRKIADCLVNGKALRIEGGPITITDHMFLCGRCGASWKESFGTGRPDECPSCKSDAIRHHPDDTAGRGRCGRGRRQFRGGKPC